MRIEIAQFVVYTAFLALIVECNHAPLDYEFSSSLHAKYNLYWNNPTDGRICMAVEVETLGWVGLGFSPTGGMVDSDIMMAWVIDGEVNITDRFAASMSLPVLDSQQDFELVEGYEEDGKTVIQFCRKLLTCDVYDVDILVGAVKVIYSWNDEDPDTVPSQHTERGVKNVRLVGALKEFPAALEDTTRIDITMRNLSVPDNASTLYWCRTIRFTQPTVKHHIVRIDPRIDSRNERYIHHLVIYVCPSTFEEMHGDCTRKHSSANLTAARDSCVHTIMSVWAVGAGSFDLPLDAGIPLGPDETFDTLMLEVHYNNPNLDSGIVDDSGISWYITDNLRTHDVGLLTIGNSISDHMAIPPQTESFLVASHCPGECTQLFPHPINVIATLPHSHTVGASIWTQIIRDKKEIGYLDLNLNYDFDFQGFITPDEPIVIQPGDGLILNCLYNTKSREGYTFGGESTEDEMCFNFIFYYPKTNITDCLTRYDKYTSFNTALDSFQCNDVDVNGSTTHEELVARATSIGWTDKIARTLEISPLVHPGGLPIFCSQPPWFQSKFPLPGVDYEVFPYYYDSCGKYNGTYYPGGHTADYYYNCSTNEPYYNPIGPTDSTSSLMLLPVVIWMLAVAVLFLF